MKPNVRLLAPFALLLTLAVPVSSQGEPDVLESIITEGKENSQVMETLNYLSEEIGVRLTGSSGLERSYDWTRDQLTSYGLQNVRLHKWGEIGVRFDRGPSHARMTAPVERDFEFTTRSWGAGTDGPVSARAVLCPTTLAELEERSAELSGAWVLCKKAPRKSRSETEEAKAAREELEAVDAALDEIAIAGRLTSSSNELIITGAVRGWRDLTMDTLPTDVDVIIRLSDYEAIAAELDQLENGGDVIVEVNLDHRFTEGPIEVHNVVADIPGTEFPDEVIILSGHLDSWDGPGSQGAQDNGTGVAAMMEAARILMAADVQPKRTIRICLWTGEEQGLFGSLGYVRDLSDEEKANISACFVDDGGTNYQGGVICIESMTGMLAEAMAPLEPAFPDHPIENTVRDRMPKAGASDHAAFNMAGIPGFYWKETGSGGQEGKNYTYIHHTQHDSMRYVVPEYMVQSATASAVVAYQLAQADTLLPREIPGEALAKGPEPDPTFKVTFGIFSGEWETSMVGDDMPDITFTMKLEMAEDGRLRGTVDGQAGIEYLKDGKYDVAAKSASFMVPSDFGELNFETRIEEAAIVGTMSVNGMELPIRGEKIEAAASPISGTWEGIIKSMDADITMVFEVNEAGELSGRFQSSQSDSKLYDAKWDPETKSLSFEYDYPHAGRLPVTAKLEGDKLVGTIGDNADFEAWRKAEEDPLSGMWKGVITSMDADISLVLNLKDGELTGRFQSSQSDSELYDAKWDPKTKTLSFEYDYPHAGRLPVTAKLEGEKLVGTIGDNADFEATRDSF